MPRKGTKGPWDYVEKYGSPEIALEKYVEGHDGKSLTIAGSLKEMIPNQDKLKEFRKAKSRFDRNKALDEWRKSHSNKYRRILEETKKMNQYDRKDAIELAYRIDSRPDISISEHVKDMALKSKRKKIFRVRVKTLDEKIKGYNRLITRAGILRRVRHRNIFLYSFNRNGFQKTLGTTMKATFIKAGYDDKQAFKSTGRFLNERIDGLEVIWPYSTEAGLEAQSKLLLDLESKLANSRKFKMSVKEAQLRVNEAAQALVFHDVNFEKRNYKTNKILEILRMKSKKERVAKLKEMAVIDDDTIYHQVLERIAKYGLIDKYGSKAVPEGLIYEKTGKTYPATWKTGQHGSSKKWYHKRVFKLHRLPYEGVKANQAGFYHLRKKLIQKEIAYYQDAMNKGEISVSEAMKAARDVTANKLKFYNNDIITWGTVAGSMPVHVTWKVKGNVLTKKDNLIPVDLVEDMQENIERTLESEGAMYVIAGPDTKEKDHMHLTFYPNPGESLTNQVKKVKLRLRKYLKDEKGINITFRRSYGFKGGGMGTLQRLVAYIKQNIDAGKNKKVVNDLNEILSQEIS